MWNTNIPLIHLHIDGSIAPWLECGILTLQTVGTVRDNRSAHWAQTAQKDTGRTPIPRITAGLPAHFLTDH